MSDRPAAPAVESLGSDQLVSFLRRQRWFDAKSEALGGASLLDFAPLSDERASLGIARVRVETLTGGRLYQIPLGVADARPENVPEAAAIRGDRQVLFDAVYDPAFRRALAEALDDGLEAVSTRGSRWIVERANDSSRVRRGGTDTQVLGAEQSNTSIVVGGAIVKLFRRLATGINPDVEVTSFLTTKAGFEHTPAFLGELRFEDDQGRSIAGMIQQFVPGAKDMWSYVLDRGRAYFTAPEDRDAPNDVVADVTTLGRITREMHAALASRTDDAAFSPEPVSRADVDRWAHRTQQAIREGLALLEKQLGDASFHKARVAEAQALVKRRDHFLAWVNEISDGLTGHLGLRTRTHGDYHLGQVLRAPDGELMVIDFEGEPSKSIDERREKTSPLRDVAGMVRSIAYAAAVLVTAHGNSLKPHVRELRVARWERDVRAAFLSGYFAEPLPSIPADQAQARLLASLFETEKAFYELSYELNNRPDWVWIPMRGISKLLTKV